MQYDELNNCLKEKTLPIQSYFLACLARRIIFTLIAYIAGGTEYTTHAVLGNLVISTCFLIYLIKVDVFEDPFIHNV